MTIGEQAVQSFRSWLETDSGLQTLNTLVKAFLKSHSQDNALTYYLQQRYSYDRKDLQEELCQDFFEYLLSSFIPQLKGNPNLATMLINGQVLRIFRFALQQFHWKLLDLARLKDTNPRAYLHRRAREALNASPLIAVHKDAPRNQLFYAPTACTTKPSFDPTVFADCSYSTWKSPAEPGPNLETVFTATYLTTTAIDFWHEALSQLGKPFMVPVRELVRYLAAHHPWLNHAQPEPLSERIDPPDQKEDMEHHFDRISTLGSIVALAAQFVHRLDEDSRKIVAWTLDDPPLTFLEIAKRLNMKDHNKPYRIHRKTIAAMKQFTRNWPGPPLDELPEDVSLAFIEEVKKICKESV